MWIEGNRFVGASPKRFPENAGKASMPSAAVRSRATPAADRRLQASRRVRRPERRRQQTIRALGTDHALKGVLKATSFQLPRSRAASGVPRLKAEAWAALLRRSAVCRDGTGGSRGASTRMYGCVRPHPGPSSSAGPIHTGRRICHKWTHHAPATRDHARVGKACNPPGIRRKCGVRGGERGRNRTFNLGIKSPLLCQLSYAPPREP